MPTILCKRLREAQKGYYRSRIIIRFIHLSFVSFLIEIYQQGFPIQIGTSLLYDTMQLQHQKVLIFGATSGIGWALASKFVETGTSVIVIGRRKEKLDDFAKQHESTNPNATVDTAVFDITDLKAIPGFASSMFKKHTDIDCVFLNSGMQRKIDWTDPENVDLETLDLEVLTNYTSYMHLSKAFLPYLQKQAPKPTSLIFTTSGLALIPILHCPNYCATKVSKLPLLRDLDLA